MIFDHFVMVVQSRQSLALFLPFGIKYGKPRTPELNGHRGKIIEMGGFSSRHWRVLISWCCNWKELTFEDFRKQSVTYILPKTGEQTQSVRPPGEFLVRGPSR